MQLQEMRSDMLRDGQDLLKVPARHGDATDKRRNCCQEHARFLARHIPGHSNRVLDHYPDTVHAGLDAHGDLRRVCVSANLDPHDAHAAIARTNSVTASARSGARRMAVPTSTPSAPAFMT